LNIDQPDIIRLTKQQFGYQENKPMSQKQELLKEAELKHTLEQLVADDFPIPPADELSELVEGMLAHIGALDFDLREILIYPAFKTWILEKRAFTPDQMRELVHTAISDEFIFYHIGEQDTNNVFRRTFSMLLLPLLLIVHRDQPYLTHDEVHLVKEKLIEYLKREKDRRGYVKDTGWAHSMAHAADAVDDVALCTELSAPDLKRLLESLRDVVSVQENCYTHMEEDRISTPVIAIMKRNLLSDEEIKDWIHSFSDTVLHVDSTPEKYTIRTNAKNFLQTLYFRLEWEELAERFNQTIGKTIKEVSIFG
jgi:hypothetical protein